LALEAFGLAATFFDFTTTIAFFVMLVSGK
jgi:hypothetical protein